jgi:acyl dehydratase
MPEALTFEDFAPGEVVEYGGLDVSADDIGAFAREFDPQPFHLDEEAARAVTGGLIASGWHTCALLLRMNCEAFLMRAAILDEAGGPAQCAPPHARRAPPRRSYRPRRS